MSFETRSDMPELIPARSHTTGRKATLESRQQVKTLPKSCSTPSSRTRSRRKRLAGDRTTPSSMVVKKANIARRRGRGGWCLMMRVRCVRDARGRRQRCVRWGRSIGESWKLGKHPIGRGVGARLCLVRRKDKALMAIDINSDAPVMHITL